MIINRMLGNAGRDVDPDAIDDLTYMLQSGSDRIGALDFQASARDYVARDETDTTLEQHQEAAELVQQGRELPPGLAVAVFAASSVGGGRPKTSITQGQRKYVANRAFRPAADSGGLDAPRDGVRSDTVRLDEMMARYASYQDLAETIRLRFEKPGRPCTSCSGAWCLTSFAETRTITLETMLRSGTDTRSV